LESLKVVTFKGEVKDRANLAKSQGGDGGIMKKAVACFMSVADKSEVCHINDPLDSRFRGNDKREKW
jgi:hypothetical protein